MVFYPLSAELNTFFINNSTQSKINFGLWFNKFIPLEEKEFKPTDPKKEKKQVEYYLSKYREYSKSENHSLHQCLKKKHEFQNDFLNSFESAGYQVIVLNAKLISPLVTGIGQSHPSEVGMVFDHTLGIPYIPASSIKGLVRFSHTLSLIKSGIPQDKIKTEKKGKPTEPYFDDEEEWTKIPLMFGTQKNRGKVIFLDIYSETVPDLHIDIMNPHYGPYYQDGKPPADYHNPVPIKFLTVKPGTQFLFRALVNKNYSELFAEVKKAYQNALEQEGVGAKTAIGYGRFKISKINSSQEKQKIKEKEQSEFKKKILASKPNEIKPLIEKLKEFPELKNDKKIEQDLLKVVNKKNKQGKISENYKMIADFFGLKLE